MRAHPMQLLLTVWTALALRYTSAVRSRQAETYGPGGCVFVDRSSSGTCVLHTRCDGHDVNNFDFSFDCVSQSSTDALPAHNTHSLGVGSFDDTEDFDTGVQCSSCLPPPGAVLKKSQKHSVNAAASSAKTSDTATLTEFSNKTEKAPAAPDASTLPAAPVGAERYGPSLCVTTWRNETSGNCIMRTNCLVPALIATYDFGFQCANENGEVSKHTFGQRSFGAQETYDTQVACDKCLALDDQPISPAEDVPKLATEVDSIKTQMVDLAKKVEALTSKIGSSAKKDGNADKKKLRGSESDKKDEKKAAGKKKAAEEADDSDDEDDDSDDDSSSDAAPAPAPAPAKNMMLVDTEQKGKNGQKKKMSVDDYIKQEEKKAQQQGGEEGALAGVFD